MVRLFKKTLGAEARLGYLGHLLTINRNGNRDRCAAEAGDRKGRTRSGAGDHFDWRILAGPSPAHFALSRQRSRDILRAAVTNPERRRTEYDERGTIGISWQFAG
jgi:hypothetical protein